MKKKWIIGSIFVIVILSAILCISYFAGRQPFLSQSKENVESVNITLDPSGESHQILLQNKSMISGIYDRIAGTKHIKADKEGEHALLGDGFQITVIYQDGTTDTFQANKGEDYLYKFIGGEARGGMNEGMTEYLESLK